LGEHAPGPAAAGRRGTYILVFLGLAAATAIELAIAAGSLPREARNAIFLTLSLVKAGLVAAFYMHLRRDSPVYTFIFLLPASMLLIFVLLTIVI
jgi:caa(3)-type oxidase subunit IV